jgi:hypothetical protein
MLLCLDFQFVDANIRGRVYISKDLQYKAWSDSAQKFSSYEMAQHKNNFCFIF